MTGPERSPAEDLRAAMQPDAAQAAQTEPTAQIEPTVDTAPTVETAPTLDTAPTVETAPTLDTAPTVETAPAPTVETAPTVEVAPAAPPAARKPRWSRRPAGRFGIPLMAILLLLAATAAAGGWLVPRTAPHPVAAPRPSTQPSAPASGAPTPPDAFPVQPDPSGTPVVPQVARPVDALLGWAQHIGPTVDIPPVALAAYAYAQLYVANTTPACHLTWTTLAGIGKVESNHGSANNATLLADGKVEPPILGDALNGQGGRTLMQDTDGGRLDSDAVYDRAVGPMQFLPSTWEQFKVDADQDGQQNPNDINDAALAAANYLCTGSRDLATSNGWWTAINSYNAPNAYAQSVFNAANQYGQLSKTVT